jgi:hypothetical protein
MTTGQKPSTFQMMKLAANSEFRAATQKLSEELLKAGIDLKSPVSDIVYVCQVSDSSVPM